MYSLDQQQRSDLHKVAQSICRAADVDSRCMRSSLAGQANAVANIVLSARPSALDNRAAHHPFRAMRATNVTHHHRTRTEDTIRALSTTEPTQKIVQLSPEYQTYKINEMHVPLTQLLEKA